MYDDLNEPDVDMEPEGNQPKSGNDLYDYMYDIDEEQQSEREIQLEKKYRASRQENKRLEQLLQEALEANRKQSQENSNLLNSIAVLLKTARNELDRKARRITNLSTELSSIVKKTSLVTGTQAEYRKVLEILKEGQDWVLPEKLALPGPSKTSPQEGSIQLCSWTGLDAANVHAVISGKIGIVFSQHQVPLDLTKFHKIKDDPNQKMSRLTSNKQSSFASTDKIKNRNSTISDSARSKTETSASSRERSRDPRAPSNDSSSSFASKSKSLSNTHKDNSGRSKRSDEFSRKGHSRSSRESSKFDHRASLAGHDKPKSELQRSDKSLIKGTSKSDQESSPIPSEASSTGKSKISNDGASNLDKVKVGSGLGSEKSPKKDPSKFLLQSDRKKQEVSSTIKDNPTKNDLHKESRPQQMEIKKLNTLETNSTNKIKGIDSKNSISKAETLVKNEKAKEKGMSLDNTGSSLIEKPTESNEHNDIQTSKKINDQPETIPIPGPETASKKGIKSDTATSSDSKDKAKRLDSDLAKESLIEKPDDVEEGEITDDSSSEEPPPPIDFPSSSNLDPKNKKLPSASSSSKPNDEKSKQRSRTRSPQQRQVSSSSSSSKCINENGKRSRTRSPKPHSNESGGRGSRESRKRPQSDVSQFGSRSRDQDRDRSRRRRDRSRHDQDSEYRKGERDSRRRDGSRERRHGKHEKRSSKRDEKAAELSEGLESHVKNDLAIKTASERQKVAKNVFGKDDPDKKRDFEKSSAPSKGDVNVKNVQEKLMNLAKPKSEAPSKVYLRRSPRKSVGNRGSRVETSTSLVSPSLSSLPEIEGNSPPPSTSEKTEVESIKAPLTGRTDLISQGKNYEKEQTSFEKSSPDKSSSDCERSSPIQESTIERSSSDKHSDRLEAPTNARFSLPMPPFSNIEPSVPVVDSSILADDNEENISSTSSEKNGSNISSDNPLTPGKSSILSEEEHSGGANSTLGDCSSEAKNSPPVPPLPDSESVVPEKKSSVRPGDWDSSSSNASLDKSGSSCSTTKPLTPGKFYDSKGQEEKKGSRDVKAGSEIKSVEITEDDERNISRSSSVTALLSPSSSSRVHPTSSNHEPDSQEKDHFDSSSNSKFSEPIPQSSTTAPSILFEDLELSNTASEMAVSNSSLDRPPSNSKKVVDKEPADKPQAAVNPIPELIEMDSAEIEDLITEKKNQFHQLSNELAKLAQPEVQPPSRGGLKIKLKIPRPVKEVPESTTVKPNSAPEKTSGKACISSAKVTNFTGLLSPPNRRAEKTSTTTPESGISSRKSSSSAMTPSLGQEQSPRENVDFSSPSRISDILKQGLLPGGDYLSPSPTRTAVKTSSASRSMSGSSRKSSDSHVSTKVAVFCKIALKDILSWWPSLLA